jgi:cytoskeletal protein CcmA (bactofilin family)
VDGFEHPYPKASLPVGERLRITGEITGEENLELHGRFNGRVDVQGIVLIGETAEVRAEVTGTTVVIRGYLVGNVTASGRMVVQPPGDLVGDVSARSFVVPDGAGFQGRVSLGPSRLAPAATATSDQDKAPTRPGSSPQRIVEATLTEL